MDYGVFGGAATGGVNGFGFPVGIGFGGGPAGAGYAGANAGGTNSGGKPTNFRDGDWMCPSCNSHNYASRSSCRDCRSRKPYEGRERGHRDRRGRGRSYSRSRSRSRGRSNSRSRSRDRHHRRRDRYNSRSRSRSYSRDRRRGGGRDMTCYQFEKHGNCQYGSSCRFEHKGRGGRGHRDDHRGGRDRYDKDNICYAFQDGNCTRGDSCRFEHVMKGGRGHGTQRITGAIRQGDWWCKNCQIHKYTFREECDCGQRKDEQATKMISKYLEYLDRNGLRPNFRPGDWECPSCKSHVYMRRPECHNCSSKGRPALADPEIVAIFGSDAYYAKIVEENAVKESADVDADADADMGVNDESGAPDGEDA